MDAHWAVPAGSSHTRGANARPGRRQRPQLITLNVRISGTARDRTRSGGYKPIVCVRAFLPMKSIRRVVAICTILGGALILLLSVFALIHVGHEMPTGFHKLS